MSIGLSLVLIAVGAALRYAVTIDTPRGVDYPALGGILMIVGGIGLVFALLWMTMKRRTEIVHRNSVDRPY